MFHKSFKREVYVTLKVKDYATPVVYKSKLTKFSKISNPILVVSKYSDGVFKVTYDTF